jgi:hypothetical protein
MTKEKSGQNGDSELVQTQGIVSKAAGLLGINRARIFRMLAQVEELGG